MSIAETFSGFLSWSNDFVALLGYPGIFIINMIGSLAIGIPLPTFIVVFIFGGILNPWVVGLAGGLGSATGTLLAYMIGRGSGETIKKRVCWMRKAEERSKRFGMFPVIVLLAFTAITSDKMAIFTGIVKYDVKKYYLATIIGKVMLHTIIAFMGYYGITYFMSLIGY